MRWKQRSRVRHNFFYSEQEIDFTLEYLDYDQFLLQEFFNADEQTKKTISALYTQKYGTQSFSYLNRKYAEWANGDFHLTDLISSRILTMMPSCLNEEAKSKLALHDFMAFIKKTVSSFSVKKAYSLSGTLKSPQELVECIEKEFERIDKLSDTSSYILWAPHHRLDLLTDEEKLEALEISKYILTVKTQRLYEQIVRDLNTFLPSIPRFDVGDFTFTYSVPALGKTVNVSTVSESLPFANQNFIKDTESNSRFKEYADEYLAYELLTVDTLSIKAKADSFLNTLDLDAFYHHYCKLLTGESEIQIHSLFHGEGGLLSLKVQILPFKLLKRMKQTSSIKVVICLLSCLLLLAIAVRSNALPIALFLGLPIALLAIGFIKNEVKEISTAKHNLKKFANRIV
jgi:hypothetical protein